MLRGIPKEDVELCKTGSLADVNENREKNPAISRNDF